MANQESQPNPRRPKSKEPQSASTSQNRTAIIAAAIGGVATLLAALIGVVSADRAGVITLGPSPTSSTQVTTVTAPPITITVSADPTSGSSTDSSSAVPDPTNGRRVQWGPKTVTSAGAGIDLDSVPPRNKNPTGSDFSVGREGSDAIIDPDQFARVARWDKKAAPTAAECEDFASANASESSIVVGVGSVLCVVTGGDRIAIIHVSTIKLTQDSSDMAMLITVWGKTQ